MTHESHPDGQPLDPWPRIGWVALLITVLVAAVLGFTVVSRYQQNGPVLNTWAAMCRGLGLTFDGGRARDPRPPLQVSSQLAWTTETLQLIRSGDPRRGAALAVPCKSCHGANGVSNAGLMPTLAGMSAAAIYKQLDDFHNGLRPWRDMTLMASLLSPQDMADVAAYWSALPGLPRSDERDIPSSERSLRQADPAIRLAYAGDPQRGIAACSACHAPERHKLGAPTLAGQQQAYIEHQLVAFAGGLRRNDINQQMRTVARQLTAEERHRIAAFYGIQHPPLALAQIPPSQQ